MPSTLTNNGVILYILFICTIRLHLTGKLLHSKFIHMYLVLFVLLHLYVHNVNNEYGGDLILAREVLCVIRLHGKLRLRHPGNLLM